MFGEEQRAPDQRVDSCCLHAFLVRDNLCRQVCGLLDRSQPQSAEEIVPRLLRRRIHFSPKTESLSQEQDTSPVRDHMDEIREQRETWEEEERGEELGKIEESEQRETAVQGGEARWEEAEQELSIRGLENRNPEQENRPAFSNSWHRFDTQIEAKPAPVPLKDEDEEGGNDDGDDDQLEEPETPIKMPWDDSSLVLSNFSRHAREAQELIMSSRDGVEETKKSFRMDRSFTSEKFD
eukprot:767691-Hanusia_phi.AAC.1